MGRTPVEGHGYVLQNGILKSYDVSNSTLTTIWDTNSEREFVGAYMDASGQPHRLLQLPDGSAPITLDYSGAAGTIAMGTNPGGVIFQYTDTKGRTHGLLAVPMPGHNH